ncbi:hypothetical protein HK099_007463 [Clydaea vesicula]|uniref:DUF726-domain-containing protein n=1 Tax=Clydaea vesicula TaxID=447962 RepID=A0AAD5XXJ9_9FUNG|nr:hypothetical protein HK099_007463 [Clydaea vesicula]
MSLQLGSVLLFKVQDFAPIFEVEYSWIFPDGDLIPKMIEGVEVLVDVVLVEVVIELVVFEEEESVVLVAVESVVFVVSVVLMEVVLTEVVFVTVIVFVINKSFLVNHFSDFLGKGLALAIIKIIEINMRYVLADTLSAQSQENRPVTLIGFSLGARIIYCCLQELAKQGKYGIIEDVYIFGCPVIASTKEWQEVSSVVAGKITNGYLERDWVLGVLYRASAASWSSVAGLSPIENVDGIVNIKLDGVIDGHLEYRLGMPKVLQHCGFKITKDYFDDDDDREEILKEELRVIKQKKEEEELRKKLEKKKREEENKEFGLKKGWFGKNDEITPKEIKSTLPALLTLKEIKSTLPTLLLSVEDRNDDEAGKSFTPKELKSTLPTLKVVSTSTTNNVTSENLEKNSHSSHSYIDVSSPNNFGSNTHVDSVIEDKFVGLTGEELEKELVKHASTQKDVYFYKSGAGDKADLDNDELEDLHNPLDLSGLALEDGGGLVWDQNQW